MKFETFLRKNYPDQYINIIQQRFDMIFRCGDEFAFITKQDLMGKISKMLTDISKESYLQAGGNVENWVKWFSDRNKLSLNSD